MCQPGNIPGYCSARWLLEETGAKQLTWQPPGGARKYNGDNYPICGTGLLSVTAKEPPIFQSPFYSNCLHVQKGSLFTLLVYCLLAAKNIPPSLTPFIHAVHKSGKQACSAELTGSEPVTPIVFSLASCFPHPTATTKGFLKRSLFTCLFRIQTSPIARRVHCSSQNVTVTV